MQRISLFAKIRDVKITSVNHAYEGSISLDADYLERSGIAEFEQVHVVNMENGSRIVTYTLEAKRGSGIVELNGPAARCGLPGDRIMVLAYCMLGPDEMKNHRPVVISVRQAASSTDV